MHIYFSGIGGAGMAPLAMIALQAGYEVSGSDKQDSQYIEYLKNHGITDIHIGQTREAITEVHERKAIDWFVYTSALVLEDPDAPEIAFCKDAFIRFSKRDKFLNKLLADWKYQLIAVAGTHGKTTTTAMVVWAMQQLGEPISYMLSAKTSFAKMCKFDPTAKYFVYEADEFDRNFLSFSPHFSLITGVSWDHHEIFPTREDYQAAFKQFISQSDRTILWRADAEYLGEGSNSSLNILEEAQMKGINLMGKYNRMDGWITINALAVVNKEYENLAGIINTFPGLSRRMEPISPGLYSDYAHTPEKIRGAMSTALEMAAAKNQKVVVVYEPLTNRRQGYIMEEYGDVFTGSTKVYWLPSYLAREDPNQRIIPPEELISHLSDPSIAVPAQRDDSLMQIIQQHLAAGDLVVGMAGGGGGSLDDWLRQTFPAAPAA